MFRIHTLEGVVFNGPLESMRLEEEIKRPDKNYSARRLIDRKEQSEDTNRRGGSGGTYSHAVKAYTDAVKINEREPVLHAYTIMKSPVLTIDPVLNIVDAWNMFHDKGISHMPVVSAVKIIGILSCVDLMKHLNVLNANKEDLAAMKVADVMTKKVITADRMTDIRRIAKVMFDHHIGTMPIVDEDGALTGIITRSDILYALINYPTLSLWA